MSITFICMLFSCEKAIELSKTENDLIKSPNINLALLSEIENLPNYAVKFSYSNLNPEEKTILWTRHFEKHLSNKKYSKAQLAHINKLFALVSVDLFRRAGTPELEAFMKEFEKEWFYKASESGLFTVQELFFIGTVDGLGIVDANLDKNLSSGRVEEVEAGCNCRYSLSCGFGGSCVSNKQCISSRENTTCGLMGTSLCDGKCSY
ncbi:bacteriocin fulvocin C-related protein [Thermoflexibacter ruber]|nr:bacteriocin fulvocin C-related protein [Thermoflexibacter ruber]